MNATGVKTIKQMNTGLVLSGGGARGIAHIGVLKAIEENNINIINMKFSKTLANIVLKCQY